jgi:hypothetical protein
MARVSSLPNLAAHLLTERITMTAPKTRQWPLAPTLRLTALALLFLVGSLLTQGWIATALLVCAVVSVVLAAIKFKANWKTRT